MHGCHPRVPQGLSSVLGIGDHACPEQSRTLMDRALLQALGVHSSVPAAQVLDAGEATVS